MNERPGSPPTTWIALIGSILVVLAVMANVLLWQILDDQDADRKGKASDQPALPAPAPTTGTSNRAAASEIDRLTRRLNRRFRQLEPDLSKLAGAADQLPRAFETIAIPLQSLNAQGQAALGTGAAALNNVAGLTGQLSDAATVTNQQLNTSNAGIAQTNLRLDDMLGRLGVMNTRFGGVVENTAGMETTIQALRGDVQQLNTNLVNLLNAICSASPAPTGCP